MADATTSQTIQDGGRNLIMKFTNVSDGTGQSAATLVDVSGLNANPTTGAACSRIVLQRMWFSNVGMGFKLFWNASTNMFIAQAPKDWTDTWDFTSSSEDLSGIPNNAGSGINGDIDLTTHGHTNHDHYTIVLQLRKTF